MKQGMDSMDETLPATSPHHNDASIKQPLSPRNQEGWQRAWALFVMGSAAISVLVGTAWGGIFTLPDAGWYLRIAQGDSSSVLQPFVLRQLGPLVCRALMFILPVGVETAFLIQGVVSLLVLLGIVGFLLVRSGTSPFMLAAIAGLAFWSEIYNGLALPDLWNAALLSIFLLLLHQKKFLPAALMLFPLFLSRESTILVLFCFFVVGWRRMRILDYGVAAVASFAGMRVVKLLTAGGLSNREQVSPLLYMAGKVPWNFAKNILGFPLWSNLNEGNCSVPQWTTNLHIGGIHTVGACANQIAFPIWTLRMALSCFGLLPLLLVFLCIRRFRAVWTDDIFLRFCLVYGALSFFLAPMLGASVPRLFAYSWPLFVVAVPIIAIKHITIPLRIVVTLLLLHLAVSWSAALNQFNKMTLFPELILLLMVCIAYAASWAMLRQSRLA